MNTVFVFQDAVFCGLRESREKAPSPSPSPTMGVDFMMPSGLRFMSGITITWSVKEKMFVRRKLREKKSNQMSKMKGRMSRIKGCKERQHGKMMRGSLQKSLSKDHPSVHAQSLTTNPAHWLAAGCHSGEAGCSLWICMNHNWLIYCWRSGRGDDGARGEKWGGRKKR